MPETCNLPVSLLLKYKLQWRKVLAVSVIVSAWQEKKKGDNNCCTFLFMFCNTPCASVQKSIWRRRAKYTEMIEMTPSLKILSQKVEWHGQKFNDVYYEVFMPENLVNFQLECWARQWGNTVTFVTNTQNTATFCCNSLIPYLASRLV